VLKFLLSKPSYRLHSLRRKKKGIEEGEGCKSGPKTSKKRKKTIAANTQSHPPPSGKKKEERKGQGSATPALERAKEGKGLQGRRDKAEVNLSFSLCGVRAPTSKSKGKRKKGRVGKRRQNPSPKELASGKGERGHAEDDRQGFFWLTRRNPLLVLGAFRGKEKKGKNGNKETTVVRFKSLRREGG